MHNEKFMVELKFQSNQTDYDELHTSLGWRKGESYTHGILVKNFLESEHLNEQEEDEVDG